MGLLDSFNPSPTSLGLMNMGANMMAASGPQATPTSLGQAVGQGMNSFTNTYGAAEQEQHKRRLEELATFREEVQRAATKGINLMDEKAPQEYLNRTGDMEGAIKFMHQQQAARAVGGDSWAQGAQTATGTTIFNRATGEGKYLKVGNDTPIPLAADAETQARVTGAKNEQGTTKYTDPQGNEITNWTKKVIGQSPANSQLTNRSGIQPIALPQTPLTPYGLPQQGQSTAAKAAIDIQKERAKANIANEQKITQDAPEKQRGVQMFNELLNSLEKNYNELDAMNEITNPDKGFVSNVGASLSASEPGQYLSSKAGSQAQSIRNSIYSARPLLSQAIMKATGMSAKQLDSNVELQNFLKSATDPTTDIKAVRKQIQLLRNIYTSNNQFQPNNNENNNQWSNDDIDYTAKKYGMTREQVLQKLNGGR